jgi:ribosome-binding factor A
VASRRPSDRAYGGAASYPRTRRVNQLLREVVADELERLADADERLRMLTVTGAETSPDLRNATIYLASISPEAAAALEERRVAIQASLGRQSHMKRTPKLRFEADPAIESGSRVEEMLRRIKERPEE